MKTKKTFKITDLLIGIVFALLFVSLGVILTINFRPLYYLDVKLLRIEQTSGLSKEIILANYNALIDYCSPFYHGPLEFPTLSASASGLQHFAEVKNIFIVFYHCAFWTFIAAAVIIVYKCRKKDISYLLVSSLTAIILPVITGLLVMLNFDRAFVLFHKLFFRNDLWLFDPAADPVITILPDTFFLHCALLIILFVLLASAVLFLIYRYKKKYSSIRYRKIKGIRI